MTERFEIAFPKLMKREKGYVNDPDDPGGETRWGFSKRSYPDEDIKNLTIERAKELAFSDFWLPAYDQIKSERLAIKIFDIGFNTSPKGQKTFKKPVKTVQKTLNRWYMENLIEDGLIGGKTISAINRVRYQPSLYSLFIFMSSSEYDEIIKNRPTSEKYRAGWLNRLYETD
ncbi:MAG: N-acetylmuramidase [Bacteroidetes bacterium]|nr:N-acetylmuramidase [Bacteroidota bacterium]